MIIDITFPVRPTENVGERVANEDVKVVFVRQMELALFAP